MAATNFISFRQRFGANQSAAQAQAARVAQKVKASNEAAEGAVNAEQQNFKNKVAAGTPQFNTGASAGGPSTNVGGASQNFNAANVEPSLAGSYFNQLPQQQEADNSYKPKYADAFSKQSSPETLSIPNYGYSFSKQPSPAPGNPFEPKYADAFSKQYSTGKSESGGLESTPQTRLYDGLSLDELKANAGMKYTGPEGMDPTKYAAQTQRAGEDLGGLNTTGGIQALGGGTGFGAALARSAGRGDFSKLQQRFGGMAQKNQQLEAQSKKTAADAKKASEDKAAAYGNSATEKEKIDAEIKKQQDDAAKGRSGADLPEIKAPETQVGDWNNTPEDVANWSSQVHGPYNKPSLQGGGSNRGEKFGWVNVKAPNGYIWEVPPDSPEAKKYEKMSDADWNAFHKKYGGGNAFSSGGGTSDPEATKRYGLDVQRWAGVDGIKGKK